MKIEKRSDGLWWPSSDKVTYEWSHVEIGLPEEISKHVSQKRTVIHAGANVGLYTQIYSKLFDTVYSFEPDFENFVCLARNCELENVFLIRGGLGSYNQCMDIDRSQTDNCGSYVTKHVGKIPIMSLDSYNIENIDLIHFDMEGFETFALEGASKTIADQRPVVAVEWLNNCRKFNRSQDEIYDYFSKFLKYRTYIHISNERVFVP